MEKFMSATEVATYISVSKCTVENLLARGDAPRYIKVGNLRRSRREELIEWTLQNAQDRPAACRAPHQALPSNA